MRHYVISLMLLLTLQGCSILPGAVNAGISSRPGASQSATHLQSIFVASSRNRNADGTFGFDRASDLSFSSYQVALPVERKVGSVPPHILGNHIEFPFREIQQMGTVSNFAHSVVRHAQSERQSSEVLVFVHGFNSDFAHSMSRTAQMDRDFNFPSATVLYAWPAASSLVSYIHDIDSTTFARDGLVDLLSGLASSEVSRIVIVGHSMGARLAMEAVRDLRLTQNGRFFRKLGGIALLSPDIDIDLFSAELQALQGISAPVVAYLSTDDDTLENFAGVFAEGKPRLGSINNANQLDGQNAILIDVANVGDPSQSDHLAVATSPLMIEAINNMARPDLITYANTLVDGAVPGSGISRFGDTVRVQLAQY